MKVFGNKNRSEELQERIAEARKNALEQETQRIDSEAEKLAHELLSSLKMKDDRQHQERLQTAEADRRRGLDLIRSREKELHQQLGNERHRKTEARRREEEELRRKAEEDRKREEERARQQTLEEERKRKEEAARVKAEEEQRQREERLQKEQEERERKAEDERRQREEEQKRIELSKHRREEEQQQREQERQERFRALIANAKTFYARNDYEHALVEIAKALVNDPTNSEALELEAKIKELQRPATDAVTEEKPKQRKKSPLKVIGRQALVKNPRRSRLLAGVIGGILTLATVVTFLLTRNAFAPPVTFAVLPWTSANNVLEEKVLGAALAGEIALRFESVKPVTVMGYSSSYALAQHSTDPAQGVFQLGYLYALQGSFDQHGDAVSVDIKLVDSKGNSICSFQYARTMGTLSELPALIAKQLSEVFKVSSRDTSLKVAELPTTTIPEAYLFYLRGMEMVHRRTPESLRNAYLLFQQAAQQDPKFGDAYAAAADALISEIEIGWGGNDSNITKAKHLAEGAIAVNPSSARGYLALGRALAQNKEYREGLAQLNAALKLAPNASEAIFEKAKVNIRTGNYTQAVEALGQAFKLNSRDPEILKTSALAFELTKNPLQAMSYHETAMFVVDDSTDYIVGPVADAITFDPDLRFSQGSRLISACERRLSANAKDYFIMYQLARLLRVMGRYVEGENYLTTAENVLLSGLRQHPKDVQMLMYLALTETRLGKYADAAVFAKRAVDLDPNNAEVRYKIARMYALQMYSQKKKEIDPKKKEEALKALRQAIKLRYRLEELTNADFYNMFDQPEFRSAIQEPLQ